MTISKSSLDIVFYFCEVDLNLDMDTFKHVKVSVVKTDSEVEHKTRSTRRNHSVIEKEAGRRPTSDMIWHASSNQSKDEINTHDGTKVSLKKKPAEGQLLK